MEEAYSNISELAMPVVLPTAENIHLLVAGVRKVQEEAANV